MNKQYLVRFENRASKALKKLDRQQSAMIMSWIKKNLVNCEDPYISGKALTGDLKGTWRYRVGDYRILANIDNDKVVILVLELGHRKEVYNKRNYIGIKKELPEI